MVIPRKKAHSAVPDQSPHSTTSSHVLPSVCNMATK
jgi:hypothetical protein